MLHMYESDDAAREAEDALVAALATAEDKFSDPHFITARALYNDWTRPPTGHPPVTEVEWRRISDLIIEDMTDPRIIVEGKDEGCIRQGSLANGWLIGAMA